jgi:hypothetical protein
MLLWMRLSIPVLCVLLLVVDRDKDQKVSFQGMTTVYPSRPKGAQIDGHFAKLKSVIFREIRPIGVIQV